jgi:hypothetical protein
MSSTTGFFGLQKLGPNDPTSTNDYAFTNKNIDTIDRLLGKFDSILSSGSSPIDDPTEPLSLTVSTTGGIIPAGRTVRYKFAWVDSYGNETAASPEATVTTNSPISRPAQAGLVYSSSGGTLLGGNYFYILSAYVGINTAETNGGTAGSITIRGGTTNSVTLTLPSLPAGADGFNVFRRGPGEAQFFYLDSIDMNVATPPSTYVDDNSVVVNNSRTPLASNLTYSTNSVAVTLPGATPSVPVGYTWKVYRTFTAGNYDSSLLEWVVSETYNGSGIINSETYDYGLSTSIGSPSAISTITSSTDAITDLQSSVSAIENELGTTPQGAYSTVANRFDGIEVQLGDVITWGQAVDDVVYDYPFMSPLPGVRWEGANMATPTGGYIGYKITEDMVYTTTGVGTDYFDYIEDSLASSAGNRVAYRDVYLQNSATPGRYAEVYGYANSADLSEYGDPSEDARLGVYAGDYPNEGKVVAFVHTDTVAGQDFTLLEISAIQTPDLTPAFKVQTTGGDQWVDQRFSIWADGRVHQFAPTALHSAVNDYILVFEDVGRTILMDTYDGATPSAGTLTIPPNADVPFPVGATIRVIQYGVGEVTVTPGAGVTLNKRSTVTLVTNGQYSVITLIKVDTDEWIISGDLV